MDTPTGSQSLAYGVAQDGDQIVGASFATDPELSGAVRWFVCPVCNADFNTDGFLTFEDFDGFVTGLEVGDASADFNKDGFLTFEDFDAFVTAFEVGC